MYDDTHTHTQKPHKLLLYVKISLLVLVSAILALHLLDIGSMPKFAGLHIIIIHSVYNKIENLITLYKTLQNTMIPMFWLKYLQLTGDQTVVSYLVRAQ